MAEALRLRDVSSRPHADALFEVLKAGLREHSRRRRLVMALEKRASQSEDALSAAYMDPATEPEERYLAERDYALNMMALQPLVVGEHPHNPLAPPFLELGRQRLALRMHENPSERELEKSVFFADSYEQRRFAASVSASIKPYGDYDDKAFAAAVAAGEFDGTA